MPKVTKSTGTLILLLVFGSIFGSFLGEIFSNSLGFLAFGRTIGMLPVTIDLAALTLTFGVMLKINIATILGFFIALFIYIRL